MAFSLSNDFSDAVVTLELELLVESSLLSVNQDEHDDEDGDIVEINLSLAISSPLTDSTISEHELYELHIRVCELS